MFRIKWIGLVCHHSQPYLLKQTWFFVSSINFVFSSAEVIVDYQGEIQYCNVQVERFPPVCQEKEQAEKKKAAGAAIPGRAESGSEEDEYVVEQVYLGEDGHYIE